MDTSHVNIKQAIVQALKPKVKKPKDIFNIIFMSGNPKNMAEFCLKSLYQCSKSRLAGCKLHPIFSIDLTILANN